MPSKEVMLAVLEKAQETSSVIEFKFTDTSTEAAEMLLQMIDANGITINETKEALLRQDIAAKAWSCEENREVRIVLTKNFGDSIGNDTFVELLQPACHRMTIGYSD